MISAAVKTGIRIGLITAAIILLFQISSIFLVYHYFKFDYYLTIVAAIFLVGGFLIARWKNTVPQPIIPEDPLKSLTVKELQIFEVIIAGQSNKEIAACHYIEVSTVKTHINNIYAKLNVGSRKELLEKFRKETASS